VKRYEFVDWYRGLACVLMFQTHAYDSWTEGAWRNNNFWWVSRHLGGFPSRLFLFLAGVSLMLRFDRDRRKNVPVTQSRLGATRRGLEVLGLAYLFRLSEWLLGFGGWKYVSDVFRVDILNCIGVSLLVAAWIASPRDLEDGRWPIPIRPVLFTLAVVFVTPLMGHVAFPRWIPKHVTSYVIGTPPASYFPLFPWLSYVLTGCVAGSLWVRATRHNQLGRAMLYTTCTGAAMALCGQLSRHAGTALYSFGDNSGGPPAPNAYFYRAGMCLLAAAVAYVVMQRSNPARFSPMRQLGKTSLMVYWVHVELVYGHLSDPIKRRLDLYTASVLLIALTAAMVGLSWLRTEWWGRSRRVIAAP
jgi:uncharacterized membrane protein